MAGAQSIAQDGRYLLHFGPYAARPRYAPGFSLLLAGALRLGVPPARLLDVVALSDAGLTFLVALGAGLGVLAVRRALGIDATSLRVRLAAAAASAIAASIATLSFWRVVFSALLHSDSTCALFGALALVAWARIFASDQEGQERQERPERRARRALGFAAGASFALCCAVRPVAGVLLAPALALVPFAFGRALWERLRGAIPWAAAGALLPAVAVGTLLARSGRPVTEWSAYDYWYPDFFALGEAFSFRYLVEGAFAGRAFSDWPGWRTLSSAVLGVPTGHHVGFLWPLGGWIAAALVARRLAAGSPDRSVRAWIGFLCAWTATHCLLFPFYFYPSQRFYLVPGHVATLFACAAVGLALASRSWPARVAALLVGVAMAHGAVRDWWYVAREVGHQPQGVAQSKVEREFATWSRMRPEVRRVHGVRFDLLQAQAIGLLDEETVRSVKVWGPLRRTPHLERLVKHGVAPYSALKSPSRENPAQRRAERAARVFRDGFESGDAGRWTRGEPP